MLRSVRAWLERVPIADPVQRAQAVTVQVLALFAITWVGASLAVAAFQGLLLTNAVDAALTFAIALPLAAAVLLLRSGRYRAGIFAVIGGISVPIAVLVAVGMEHSLPLLPLAAIPLAGAALLLGRRTLWLVLAVFVAALAVAALRDQGHLGGPAGVQRILLPLGLLAHALLTYLLLAVVLDRFGGLAEHALADALRRESDLKASEERFRLVFATSPDAMNLVRLSDGVYELVNDAFVRLSGFSAGEMVGRTSAERDLWVDRAQRSSLMEQVARGEAVHDVETQFRRKDGSVFTGLLSGRRVTISGSEYLLGVVRDITDRRRSEQEREALQEQLRQAQKMEAIGRLAGGVAHDFNNVLTSILASAQLLEESLPGDHPSREDVQQIDADARRAAELTRQLLSFARRQDTATAPQVVRIEDRARSLEKMLRRVMGANIEVETSFPADTWPVFVDPGQVEQVILNLAVNARDAMPSGGRLRIAAENVAIGAPARPGEPAPGDYVLLSVADTGTGMTPEVTAHAFEPFFTTKGSQGTGLGLATCFGIVTQAGGTIAVESTPGTGTRFLIHLPRAAAVAAPGDAHALDLRGSGFILVVEDDARVRRLAALLLQQLGYEVIEAGSASEAQAKLSRRPGRIDCLVIDVQLPDGEGRAAAARILAGREDVPVLFVSGSPDAPGAARGAEASSSDLLAKPYTPIELARRVRSLVSGARPPARARG